MYMGRRESGEEHVRNIQKSKGSYSVTLPINIVRSLKWRERQKVVIRKDGKRIIIEDWKE